MILGGGACGMTAALSLARAGTEVTVLEREPRAGGLCGTQEYRGFRFDLGGHRFITRRPELETLVRELVGSDLLLRTRSSVILHRGQRYRYPLDLEDVVRRFGLARGAHAVASYLGERLRQRLGPEPDLSFEDWVAHRFGRVLYDAFFGPYTHKLWGIPPETISADWAAERISLLDLSDVLWRLLGLRRSPDGTPRTYARRYLYPRRGIGQIFEHMAEAIGRAGGQVVTGALVVGLGLEHGRPARLQYRDATGEHELPCDAVISTLALPLLVRMLGAARGQLDGEVERAAGRLRFRAIRLLNVLINRPEVSPHTWMYVSEPRYLAARIQEPRHRSPEAAPPGQTSLMLEIPCDVGDDIWCAPRQALYERCMEDLEHLGLRGLRRDTIDCFDSFVEEGYPVYHLDYRRDRARALDFVSEVPGLVSCGRQGAFRYIFMDTAMAMGQRAAEAVLQPFGEQPQGAAGHHGGTRDIADWGAEQGLIEARALTA